MFSLKLSSVLWVGVAVYNVTAVRSGRGYDIDY